MSVWCSNIDNHDLGKVYNRRYNYKPIDEEDSLVIETASETMKRPKTFEFGFANDKRGLSNIVGVSILIFAAVGLGVAIFTATGGFVDDIQEPPQADIGTDLDTDEDEVTFTLQSASDNVDSFEVQGDGFDENDGDDWDDGAETGETMTIGDLDEDETTINIVAIDEENDNDRVVEEFTF